MKRQTLYGLAAVLCLASLGLGPAMAAADPYSPGGHAGASRPNIILCMTDDQGWGDTGCNGHPLLKTPELDAMAAARVRFDRFFSAHPMCSPTRALEWDSEQSVREVALGFDTDFDHPMESVLMGHPERRMPACVETFTIEDGDGAVVAEESANHQTRRRIVFDRPVVTRRLTIRLAPAQTGWPPAMVAVRCYA